MKILRLSNQLPSHRLRALARPVLLLLAAPLAIAQNGSIRTRAAEALPAASALDGGALPVSEPLTLTLHLQPSPTQTVALDQLLAAQTDAASPDFHRWLTPRQFARQFGPTEDQLAALTRYLDGQGLAVTAISPAHTRLTVTGTAGQAQRAFSVHLRRFTVGSAPFFANSDEPVLPVEFAGLVGEIAGLDNLPHPASARITLAGAAAAARPRAASFETTADEPSGEGGDLGTIASAVDLNASPILALSSSTCASDLAPSESAAYRAVFRQANAQGITVLVAGACQSSLVTPGFPASVAEVTALTVAPQSTGTSTGTEPRPRWQFAPGLPDDKLRHEPDLTTTSVNAFAQAITTLNLETGNRLGNINATLYTLAKIPGLFTQPDAVPDTPPAGNWEPATGLGLIDLNKLLKVYPRISNISTKTSLVSSSYALNYGNPFTLSSNVQVTGVIPPATATNPAPPAPTGVVTFTASTQGVLGTSGIDGGGSATLDSGVLPVGTYVLTATYSGDAYYAPSSSTSNVTITVSLVNARLAATISPSTNIPYGAAATVTATVTLPGSSASPSGAVFAQISSGAPASATLSPNPGSNSATANISLNVPPPGSYNVQVTCQGTTNFQCQTPVNIPINTVKGYTSTTVAVTPAAPQAGQPVSLTATIVNSGNGTATYTYGGAISFFDSGKLLATAPVATNQATTTTRLSGTRTHNITAVYTGDTNWTTSTSNAVAVQPTILPDELTLSTNITGLTSLAGINVIFTGSISTTVTYQSGPTGTLTFFDIFNNSVVQLGNPAALVANGPYASIGLFTTTGLLPGVHRIYAQYSGDDNYAPAISQVLVLSLSDFNVTMTPSTLTLTQGKSAQVTALIGASGGFTGNVSLGCTPPGSSEATCNISPSTISVGQSATVTITTTAPRWSRSGQHVSALRGWGLATGASLAGLLFLAVPRRSRRLPTLLLALLAVSLTANLGCGLGVTSTNSPGTGTGSNPADPGTPLGTQNYTVTAASSDGVNTVRHTYQYQVTVQ